MRTHWYRIKSNVGKRDILTTRCTTDWYLLAQMHIGDRSGYRNASWLPSGKICIFHILYSNIYLSKNYHILFHLLFFDKSKNLHVWCTADIPTISYNAHGYIFQLMMNLHFWLSHICCISNTRPIWLDSLDCKFDARFNDFCNSSIGRLKINNLPLETIFIYWKITNIK